MADTSKTTPKSIIDTPAIASLRDIQDTGFASASKFGAAWLEAMNDLGSEVLSFVVNRVKEDVQTQHEVVRAKSLADVHHIQSQFVQKTIDQYTAETGKLVAIGKAVMTTMPASGIMPD